MSESLRNSPLFRAFEQLADAPGGVAKLREFFLQLAVQGRLVRQNPDEEPAMVTLKMVERPVENLPSFEIPNNWRWMPLGSLGRTQTGSTPSKAQPENFGSEYPFIKPADILPDRVNYDNEALSAIGVQRIGRIAPAGSILMVCIGTIGKCNFIERECSFNQQINSLTPTDGLNHRLLTYFVRSGYFQQEALRLTNATTIAILNKGNWETILVPLPPLAEQKRIVAKVEQLLALCDELETRLKDVDARRARLLSAAIADLLTASAPAE